MSTDPAPDFEDRFAEAVARIEERSGDREPRHSPLWLSHHWPDQYDRCVVIGGRPVCRRCLTLYGISFVVAAVSLAGLPPWPGQYDAIMIWGLSIVGTAEFAAEQAGLVGYRAGRQVLATALVALAFGRALAYELEDRWNWYFWGPILVFGTVWFVAALVGNRRRSGTDEIDPSR